MSGAGTRAKAGSAGLHPPPSPRLGSGRRGRALGRRPAHRPSHLLPAKTHRLPLKRLHLKGEMEAKGRQEPGGWPALGSGWLVPRCAVAWEGSQDPVGVLGGGGGAGAAPLDAGVCRVPGYLPATSQEESSLPGGSDGACLVVRGQQPSPVRGLYQRRRGAARCGYGIEGCLPGGCWEELLFLPQPE